MAKGTRYTPEFRAKAVRLLTESRGSYPSEARAVEQVARDPGVAPETLRRWRDKTDATVVYGYRKTHARSSARGRDRPRPGDERHAGIGNPRRAPRQGARHHQTGEGHGRRARPRGTRVRGGGAEPAAPVLGPQDTGTDRNRVLCKPSGASRPTIGAEQKSGHITSTTFVFYAWDGKLAAIG